MGNQTRLRSAEKYSIIGLLCFGGASRPDYRQNYKLFPELLLKCGLISYMLLL